MAKKKANVVPHPSAPGGWGVGPGGHFAPLPSPAPSPAPSPGGGGGTTTDPYGNIVTPNYDASGNIISTTYSPSPENTAAAEAAQLASIPPGVLATAVAGFEGDVSQSILDLLAKRVSTPTIGGRAELSAMAGGQGRLLGPSEFKQLREQFGVSEANFDQFFSRDAQGNIFLKPGVGGAAGTPGAGVPGVGAPGAGVPGVADGVTQDPDLKVMEELLAHLKGRGDEAFEARERFAEQIGLTQAQTRDAEARANILKLDRDLDKLEGEINERISGKGVSEALRQRILRTEKRPMLEQLADLQREAQIAGTGLSAKRQELSDLMNLYAQQQENTIDQFKVALRIAERQSELAREAGQDERDIVKGYIEKYPDAGIALTDSLAIAQSKLSSSKLYQDDIRLLSRGGGGTGTGPSYKLPSGIKTKLIGGGFDATEIGLIEKDIQEFGLDAVIEGITDPNQLKAINDAFGREDPKVKEAKGVDVRQQLKKLGWPEKAIRRFLQDQEASFSSLSPSIWRRSHPELFEEPGE